MKQLIKLKLEAKNNLNNKDIELKNKASFDMPWLQHFKEEDIKKEIPSVSIYDYIYNYGKDHLKDTALIYPNKIGDRKWSYKSLFKEINKVSKAFVNLGVKKHDIVTICTPNIVEAVFSFYALTKLGVVINFIHPFSSAGEINTILLTTNSKYFVSYEGEINNENNIDKIHVAIKKTKVKKVIITNPSEQMPKIFNIIYTKDARKNRNFIYENDKKFIEWKNFLKKPKKAKKFGKSNFESSETALLLCTGGSTGLSKLVELSHDNINACTETIKIDNDLINPSKDSTIVVMPLFHGFGLSNCLHLALVSGVKAVLMPKYNAKDFTKQTKKYKTSITLGVPKIFSGIIETGDKLNMKNQKYMIYGGDKMSIKLNNDFNKYLKSHNAKEPFMGAFGLTECVAAVTRTKKEVINIKAECEYDLEVTNVGIPFVHNDIMIVKPHTFEEIDGYNKLGVICIGGPTVAKGYYKNTQATNNTFFKYNHRNWLYTGDMGFIDKKSGCLFYAQREKRLIITSGYNVYPAEVEKHINKVGPVRASALIGIKDEKKGEIPILFVVAKYNTVIKNEKELIEKIKDISKKNLPRYSIPKEIFVIEDFPLTKMNKVDIYALEDLYTDIKKV